MEKGVNIVEPIQMGPMENKAPVRKASSRLRQEVHIDKAKGESRHCTPIVEADITADQLVLMRLVGTQGFLMLCIKDFICHPGNDVFNCQGPRSLCTFHRSF